MHTRQSRRQFLRSTAIVLSAACGSCRDHDRTNDTAATPPPTTGTNSAAKWPDNVSGRFFVTEPCIDCGLCREAAPANFTRNDTLAHFYVFKQPTSESELKLCLEAAEGCPVEAIIDSQKQ